MRIYRYRAIFEGHFPSDAAAASVPCGPSIACSTPRALAWDAGFKDRGDCSGRAVAGVHDAAYGDDWQIASLANAGGAPAPAVTAAPEAPPGKRKR